MPQVISEGGRQRREKPDPWGWGQLPGGRWPRALGEWWLGGTEHGDIFPFEAVSSNIGQEGLHL